MIVLLIAVVVFGWVAIIAIRNPLLARLAAREAVRRRSQSLLVIGGLMIGAAAITASLVGADSNQRSFTNDAYRSWGNVDLTVSAGGRFFDPAITDRIADDAAVARITDGIEGGVELVGSVSDLTRRQSEPAVSIVGFDPAVQAAFGPFTLRSGLETLGDDLGADGVLLSRGLAEQLEAMVGDRLTVQAETGAGPPSLATPLRVAGIARSEGPGAYGLRPTVFAPRPLVERILGTDQINVVWISANGDQFGGLDNSLAVAKALRSAVVGAGTETPLRVQEVKRSTVENARDTTQFLRVFLLAMSFLIVAAGAALVVNLVLMLAEERRPRLGVLRALGLSRRKLIQLSLIEGAMYSLVAAVVGTAIGIGAGRIVAGRFASAFSQFFGGDADFHFVFAVQPATLAGSFAGGALVTLATVALAARRTARMNIPAAIRDLSEPPRESRPSRIRRLGLALIATAGVALVAASISGRLLPRLVGGTLVIVAASAALRRRMGQRAHSTLTGGALALWAFVMSAALTDPSIDPNEFFAVFTIAVLQAVFGLSILASANLQLAERAAAFVGRASNSLRRNLRAPLAYLARRPLRTGLTTGIFAVIVAILALFSVFLSTFRPQYERDSAGFDLRLTATASRSVSIPTALRSQVQRTDELPTIGYLGPFEAEQFSSQSAFIPLFQLDPERGSDQPVRLQQRDERFDSDQAVWDAVFANPRFVISDFAGPGQELTLTTATGRVTFEVVASQQGGILDGIMGSPRALQAFDDMPRGVTVLVDARSGSDAAALARRMEASLFAQGIDVQTTRKLLDDIYRANQTFFSVIDILMRMGLVVGILSLGILGFRAVVERRHVIGVLRAIGYRKRGVMAGLMAEAGVTATLGVLVGVVTGLVMGWLFVRQQAGAGGFGVDAASLGGVLALVYVAVVLVTVWPAWRASRLPPAEAVRYSE